MGVSIEAIKELRHATSASVAHCRKALVETKGDVTKAATWLRKKGLEIAKSKQGRASKEGRVEAYVHQGNKIGVLLEVNCETDFAAKNAEFAQFSRDVAMHIAACDPEYLKKEDVPEKILKEEKNKEEFCKSNCLLEQVFIKDPSITINDYLGSLIAKIGENILIRRFIRYKIGE
ncbi:MAG: elongation factor Ts [Candidatus Omnitrophica bacterium]|nr:elongation factor Ts [Candidatus Omnitrophota bacterium]MBU1905850.1 elongation factor Ts [Candidatus Omnitrophota bacterium]